MILRPFITQAASVVPPLPSNIASTLSNVRGGAVAGAALQVSYDMHILCSIFNCKRQTYTSLDSSVNQTGWCCL